MEKGFCHICSNRNAPEDKKCKRCGTELINLDRSSNMSQGIRSGLISGLIMAVITSIPFSIGSTLLEKDVKIFECLLILIVLNIIKGLAIGAIAGKTGTLCFYKDIQAIGIITDVLFLIIAISQYGYLKEIGMITTYMTHRGMRTSPWFIWFLSGSLIAPLASYIERKYFRKMTWL